MPSFAYRAVHASGRIARGEMAAANENELGHYLSQSGLELIDAREVAQRAMPALLGSCKIHPRHAASFFARMQDMLCAGISFPEALRDSQSATENVVLAEALAQIAQAVANGKGIAASFALYPRLFSSVYIAMIGAGETSGDMKTVFGSLARYASSSAQTHDRLRRALRYPLFLFLVAGGAVGFMASMVLPQIAQFLNGLEAHPPFATRALIFFSEALSAGGGTLLWLTCISVAGLFITRRFFPPAALFCDRLLLRLPMVGPVLMKASLARFANSFSLLFRSGCDVRLSLAQARETLGNQALKNGIERAEERLTSGASLSIALGEVLPAFALGVLRTGEKSGSLGKSLDDIAAAYDREAMESLDAFIGLLEPCLTLAIGAILAWTVIAVLGPLYGSLSVLGGRL